MNKAIKIILVIVSLFVILSVAGAFIYFNYIFDKAFVKEYPDINKTPVKHIVSDYKVPDGSKEIKKYDFSVSLPSDTKKTDSVKGGSVDVDLYESESDKLYFVFLEPNDEITAGFEKYKENASYLGKKVKENPDPFYNYTYDNMVLTLNMTMDDIKKCNIINKIRVAHLANAKEVTYRNYDDAYEFENDNYIGIVFEISDDKSCMLYAYLLDKESHVYIGTDLYAEAENKEDAWKIIDSVKPVE